ncbi:hypothetical protein [Marinimicrococcus flavescens]|uniref:Yip1 domain-containing protein n=1 Tax=Marinimicrococcus flavescens TaxID=3031815 RepID=A0AAP3XRP3_9PROT|nr:hypothetical protein [Marinimicrococcus flavescens]
MLTTLLLRPRRLVQLYRTRQIPAARPLYALACSWLASVILFTFLEVVTGASPEEHLRAMLPEEAAASEQLVDRRPSWLEAGGTRLIDVTIGLRLAVGVDIIGTEDEETGRLPGVHFHLGADTAEFADFPAGPLLGLTGQSLILVLLCAAFTLCLHPAARILKGRAPFTEILGTFVVLSSYLMLLGALETALLVALVAWLPGHLGLLGWIHVIGFLLPLFVLMVRAALLVVSELYGLTKKRSLGVVLVGNVITLFLAPFILIPTGFAIAGLHAALSRLPL